MFFNEKSQQLKNQDFLLVKVKDRLNQGTRDIAINAYICNVAT